jgi:hypothetical protein
MSQTSLIGIKPEIEAVGTRQNGWRPLVPGDPNATSGKGFGYAPSTPANTALQAFTRLGNVPNLARLTPTLSGALAANQLYYTLLDPTHNVKLSYYGRHSSVPVGKVFSVRHWLLRELDAIPNIVEYLGDGAFDVTGTLVAGGPAVSTEASVLLPSDLRWATPVVANDKTPDPGVRIDFDQTDGKPVVWIDALGYAVLVAQFVNTDTEGCGAMVAQF